MFGKKHKLILELNIQVGKLIENFYKGKEVDFNELVPLAKKMSIEFDVKGIEADFILDTALEIKLFYFSDLANNMWREYIKKGEVPNKYFVQLFDFIEYSVHIEDELGMGQRERVV